MCHDPSSGVESCLTMQCARKAVKVPVIDLRCLCTEAADYSELSPIESSEQGSGKIAAAIVGWLESTADTQKLARD